MGPRDSLNAFSNTQNTTHTNNQARCCLHPLRRLITILTELSGSPINTMVYLNTSEFTTVEDI